MPLSANTNSLQKLKPGIRLAVSIGESKDFKLLRVTKKLSGKGVVILPDSEELLFVTEFLERNRVKFIACFSDNSPQDNKQSIKNIHSDNYKLFLTDTASIKSIPHSNFNFVIHWFLSESADEYISHLNHFASSEKETIALLFFALRDRETLENLIKNSDNIKQRLSLLYHFEDYITSDKCRFLKLTSQRETGGQCGICDNCRKLALIDSIFEIDQEKIETLLYTIVETREKFGKNTLTDILKGTSSARVKEYDLIRSKKFGKLKLMKRAELLELIEIATQKGLIRKSGGLYPAYYLSPQGKMMLKQVDITIITLPKKMVLSDDEEIDMALLEELRTMRRKRAKELNIQAFALFSDSVLKNIVIEMPLDRASLAKVKGVGKVILDLAVNDILDIVREYSSHS